MTRLAVLADIHGNLPALNAVIDDMAQFRVDQVVVAGDSVNVGPFSRETLECISGRGWAIIRGNNAYYVTDFMTPRMPPHWSSFTLPPWLNAQLGPRWIRYLACLPDTLTLRFPDAAPIRVVHGVPGNPWAAITPLSTASQVHAWLRDIPEAAIICAHSHIALERQVDRWRIFNPGSVGNPLDGERSASYLILDGDHAGWRLAAHRRAPFDDAAIYAAYERQGFIQRGGIAARLLEQEMRRSHMRLYPYLRWKQGACPNAPDSLALFDAFQAVEDTRPYMPPEYRDLKPRLYRD